jgi:HK97 family phage prohead protease
MTKEKRYLNIDNQNLQLRAYKEGDDSFIEGYAIVFDQKSKLIYENNRYFYEIIRKSSMNGILENPNIDVLATYNHNLNEPLARLQPSKGKDSLTLTVDDFGVKFRFKVINTTLSKDVAELVARDIVTECSFIFTIEDQNSERWSKDEEGNNVREILQFKNIYDITLTPNGAYDVTFAESVKRNLEQTPEDIIEEIKEEEIKTETKQTPEEDPNESYLIDVSAFILANEVV